MKRLRQLSAARAVSHTFGPMTLRTAVRGCMTAREKALGTGCMLLTIVAREVGKELITLELANLDRLAEMERFR